VALEALTSSRNCVPRTAQTAVGVFTWNLREEAFCTQFLSEPRLRPKSTSAGRADSMASSVEGPRRERLPSGSVRLAREAAPVRRRSPDSTR
jgi:hypothetical protein